VRSTAAALLLLLLAGCRFLIDTSTDDSRIFFLTLHVIGQYRFDEKTRRFFDALILLC
jgi:hypothetical protein